MRWPGRASAAIIVARSRSAPIASAILRTRLRDPGRPSRARALRVGLVNNMPDAALEAAERQFAALLAAAAPDHPVAVVPFAFPEVPRSDWGRKYVAEHYFGIEDLWDSDLDALIITGAEPRARSLRDEPYWKRLVETLDWAQASGTSLVLSCLAAHAAALHLDGIAREPLGEKRFGVYEHDVLGGTFLTRNMAPRLRVPHSRWNELPASALVAEGYQILTRSPQAGVDCFVKFRSRPWLFFQGHPEYDADTLLKEYHRDVRRFLKRESETYPGFPNGYFTPEAIDRLDGFRTRALSRRDETLMSEFPVIQGLSAPVNEWRSSAAAIYRNWLGALAEARQASC